MGVLTCCRNGAYPRSVTRARKLAKEVVVEAMYADSVDHTCTLYQQQYDPDSKAKGALLEVLHAASRRELLMGLSACVLKLAFASTFA